MASTKITLKEAGEMLVEFDKAYKHFYQNSDELLLLVDERTKAKEHDFYEQISKDSKELIKKKGFSNSWIWGLFFEEKQKNRKFHNPYLRTFEELIIFYQDHIFIKYDEEGNIISTKGTSIKSSKDISTNENTFHKINPSTYDKIRSWKFIKAKNVLYLVSVLLIIFSVDYFIVHSIFDKKNLESGFVKDPTEKGIGNVYFSNGAGTFFYDSISLKNRTARNSR